MHINSIKIQNFRNYNEQEIDLSNNINIFYGDNAQGKTNIIEAVYLSAFGKSFRATKDIEMIRKGEDSANVEISYTTKDRQGNIKINIADKKEISINGVKAKKYSELLGKINIVLFTPDDISILKSSPDERRRFLNIMISQLRTGYVYNLNNYMKILKQRNNYLKEHNLNLEMLDIWDEKLVEYAEKIYEYRKEFIEKIKERIGNIHKGITNEKITLTYKSDFKNKEELLKKLKEKRKIDLQRGFTSVGTHRDDFKVCINGEPVKIYGSQGQNRTSILSLKLAELQVIYDEIGEYPVLLLDDFMSELDETRIKNFLQNVKGIQVIITCTNNIDIPYSKSFKVNKGIILNNDI